MTQREAVIMMFDSVDQFEYLGQQKIKRRSKQQLVFWVEEKDENLYLDHDINLEEAALTFAEQLVESGKRQGEQLVKKQMRDFLSMNL